MDHFTRAIVSEQLRGIATPQVNIMAGAVGLCKHLLMTLDKQKTIAIDTCPRTIPIRFERSLLANMCSDFQHHPSCRCDGSAPTIMGHEARTTDNLSRERPLRNGEGVYLFGTPFHEPPPYHQPPPRDHRRRLSPLRDGEGAHLFGAPFHKPSPTHQLPPEYQGRPSGQHTKHEVTRFPDSRHGHSSQNTHKSRSSRSHSIVPDHHSQLPPHSALQSAYEEKSVGRRRKYAGRQAPGYHMANSHQQAPGNISVPSLMDPTHDPVYAANWRPLKRSNAVSFEGHAPRPTLDFPARGTYHQGDSWVSGRIPVHDGAQRSVEYVQGDPRASLEGDRAQYGWPDRVRPPRPPYNG